MENNVTIKLIAQMAGVHRSTVDKVLHGRPGVSDEVRKKIQDIINASDYKPNAIGKALKYQEKRRVIAFVGVHVASEHEIKSGIIRAHKEFGMFGFAVEFHYTGFWDVDGQVRILNTLSECDIAGVIVQALFNERVAESIKILMDRGIPVVIVNSGLPDCEYLCYVGQNARIAGRTAARLTKELLHCRGRVVVINGSYNFIYTNQERSNEFLKHISEICPEIEIVEVVESAEDEVSMFESARDVLNRWSDIDCFYVVTGGLRGVGQAIGVSGMKGRTKIICYDLYTDVKELINDGTVLATICQGLEEQGYQSFRIIVNYHFYGELPKKNFFTKVDAIFLENMVDDAE